ncbi:MAG: type II toxin-antitoxin system VapC family toxin [Deltaproteobacteria bacterium]|nr:MAG: type II toxin-antitoxin system VapC family toxin [Deltaproteobacteria bacterium]
MREKAPLLFDSHALLKLFQKEAGHEKIARMLSQAMRSSTPMYMNAINLGEIIYSTKRAFGDQKKIEVLAHVERLGFRILPVQNDLVFRAAEYKASFSMSFPDCFALASAVEHGAVLVTGDPEFRAVEHLVAIAWV